jgi:hypothetical protein
MRSQGFDVRNPVTLLVRSGVFVPFYQPAFIFRGRHAGNNACLSMCGGTQAIDKVGWLVLLGKKNPVLQIVGKELRGRFVNLGIVFSNIGGKTGDRFVDAQKGTRLPPDFRRRFLATVNIVW